MALNFPTSPTLGDLHTEGLYIYEYDGKKWQPVRRSYVITKQEVLPTGPENNVINIDLSTGNFFNTTVSKTSTINFINAPNSENHSRFFVKVNTSADYSDTNITYYDIENLTYDNITTGDISPYSVYSFGFGGPNGGDYLYFLNYSRDTLYRWDLAENYNISTLSNLTESTIIGNSLFYNMDDLTDFYITNDGSKLFITGVNASTTRIAQFSFSTENWNISGLTGQAFVDLNNTSTFASFTFSENGEYIYALEYGATSGEDSLDQYQLNSATPFDLSQGITLLRRVEIIGTNPTSTLSKIRFDSNGKNMFILDRTINNLTQYELSTAWDISTASIVRVNDNINNFVSGNTYGIEFNQDGSKLFRLTSGQSIEQWNSSNISTDTICDIIWQDTVKWEYSTTPTTPNLNKSALFEFQTLDGGNTYYARQIINNI